RIAGLVLIGGTASWAELGPPMRMARLLHGFIPERNYHKAIARILAPGDAEPGTVRAALRRQMERRTKTYISGVIAALTGAGKFDLRPRLAEVRAPTLVVHSEADRVTPFSAAKTLARIPDAAVAAVEGG